MKTKLSLTLLLSLAFGLLSSQVPQGFNYQAVARNASGLPIINQALPVRMTIQSDSLGGTIYWQELHSSIITTDQGVINLVIGKGSRQTASTVAAFSAIDWSVTPKFLKIEIDYSGWKTLGVSRLWSVPYAKVAENLAGSIKSLSVAGETSSLEEALFEVKNKDGQAVFAVYNEGVRIYVSDGAKAVKGGFAVGGFGTDKAESSKYLFVGKDSVRIYLDTNPATKKVKGGFAVGGYDLTKGTVQDYLDVSADSVRIYIDSDPTAKKLKGGFAVGGYDMTKGANTNYMNVNTDASGIINPSQNRILWYPLKNSFLTGKVLIESSTNVGENSFASGYESKAKGNWSQALGFKAAANGDYSTAIGKNAVANNINSFAFGDSARATNDEGYAIGRGAVASGYRSFAFGSAGVDSLGEVTDVTRAIGDYSFAIGQGSQSTGFGSFSFGLADTARGRFSVALGYKTCAESAGAVALGYNTTAGNDHSTAMGFKTKSYAFAATAMGYNTLASGWASIAMGDSTVASGWHSTAMGYYTKATGMFSTAIGAYTKALSKFSTTMGYYTTAMGYYTTAMGGYTSAIGYGSTAMGYYTYAPSFCETAVGSFNTQYTPAGINPYTWNSNDRLFVIGNGTGESSRSNAMTVLKNGNVGIGTSTPLSKLELLTSGYNAYAGIGINSSLTGGKMITINQGTAGKLNFTVPGVVDLVTFDFVNSSVGIWDTTPDYTLTINGTAWCSAGTWIGSDMRWKKNILSLDRTLEGILSLQSVSYELKTDEFPEMGFEPGRQIGLIAQDVEKIFPQLVKTNNDGYKSIAYDKLSAVLVEAIKEQQQQIELQQKEINDLKSLVNSIIANQTAQLNE